MTEEDFEGGTSYERSSGGDMDDSTAGAITAFIEDDDYLSAYVRSSESWEAVQQEILDELNRRRSRDERELEEERRKEHLRQFVQRQELSEEQRHFITKASEFLDGYDTRAGILANLLKPDLGGGLLDLFVAVITLDLDGVLSSTGELAAASAGLMLKAHIMAHMPHAGFTADGAAGPEHLNLQQALDEGLEEDTRWPADKFDRLDRVLKAAHVADRWAEFVAPRFAPRLMPLLETGEAVVHVGETAISSAQLVHATQTFARGMGPEFNQTLEDLTISILGHDDLSTSRRAQRVRFPTL